MEATFYNEGDVLPHTPASALESGEVFTDGDGLAAVAVQDIAANALGSKRKRGIHRFASASGTTFAKDDAVFWDASANLAITAPGEAADVYLGRAIIAKASGETVVLVDLNGAPSAAFGTGVIESPWVEVDFETGVTTAVVPLIPAAWNKTGMIYEVAYGRVTEVFGGASQDQGIGTVEDTDGTDICTLTPSDSGADAANDLVLGTADLPSGATGDAMKIIAAGKGVQLNVTQATSGSGAAGKMKIKVRCLRL